MRELLIDYCSYLYDRIKNIDNAESITLNDMIAKDVLEDVLEELSEILMK